MMKFSGKKLFFIPGICWGGLWIGEFFLYPELWFFACCAVAVGVGFIIPGLLKSRWRDVVGLAALTVLALLPWRELHSALFPLVFGYCCSWQLTAEPGKWEASRSFSGGFMLGAVLAVISGSEIFFPLLLVTAAWNLPELWKKAVAVALAAAVVCCGMFFGCSKKTVEPGRKTLLAGEMITALSWVEPGKNEPKVVFFGGDRERIAVNTEEFSTVTDISYHDSVAAIPSDADVIFAVDAAGIGDGGISECARKLKSGGVLVIPASECGLLPQWKWQDLPGSNGFYAVAGKGRELKLDPDKMDENFSGLFAKKYPNPPLAGALAGMLICEAEQPVKLESASNWRWWWLGGLAVLTAVLSGYLWRQWRRDDRRKVQLTAMVNTGGQALLTAVLLPKLLESFSWQGVTNVLIALGALWFIRRSTGLRSKSSKRISWIVFWVIMFFCLVSQWEVFMLAALIAGGSAYADLDEDLQQHIGHPSEPARFLAIACGIGVVCLMVYCQVPWTYQLLVAAGARCYSWIRN